jgi:hypothetical protein
MLNGTRFGLEHALSSTQQYVFMLSSSIDRNDIKRAESYPMVKRILEKPLDVYQFKQALNVIFGV